MAETKLRVARRPPRGLDSKGKKAFGSLLGPVASTMLQEKNRRIIYFLLAIILVLIWYGPYLISDKLGIFDTKKDTFFFAYLGQSLKMGDYPFFFVAPPLDVMWYPTLEVSHVTFGNPEVYSFSPDMIFLSFFSAARFAKIHFGLHLLVGVYGIYLLAVRLGLRLELALGLLLLVLLNPWYLQHLAIGYYPWINASLFPLMAALLIPTQKGKYNVCFAALLNALILYQGGLHLFVWFNGTVLLVALVASFKYKSVGPISGILVFYAVSIFAALPKLWLGFTGYKGVVNPIGSSYNSLEDLWAVLTDCVTNLYNLPQAYHIHNIAWYDGSLYMGTFFIVLVAIAIVLGCINERWKILLNEMMIASVILLVISWGNNWARIVSFFDHSTKALFGRPIHFLHAERYPWRFLFPSVLLLSAFSMVQLSTFVPRIRKVPVKAGVLCVLYILLVLIASDLWKRNYYFSQVATSERSYYGQTWNIKNHMRGVPVLNSNLRLIPEPWQNGIISPNKVEIPPKVFSQGDIIVLPWLKFSDASLFKAENCTIGQITFIASPNAGEIPWVGKDAKATTITILDRKRSVVLTYDKNSFYTASVVGLFGVAAAFAISKYTGMSAYECD